MTPEQEICVECQECCQWMTFVLDVPDKKAFTEFYETRGCLVRDEKLGSRIAVMVPQTCQHLKASGCEIYEKRPELCQKYDGREDYWMYDLCKLPLLVPKDGND